MEDENRHSDENKNKKKIIIAILVIILLGIVTMGLVAYFNRSNVTKDPENLRKFQNNGNSTDVETHPGEQLNKQFTENTGIETNTGIKHS